jgi:CRISPR/Cas system CMR-associated protein Cmr1 (group 7 of RAMP superfamily)
MAEERRNRIVYASDLAEYHFCPRAWYIKNVDGIKVETEEIRHGSEEHESTISLAVKAEKAGKTATPLLILAILILVIGLCLLFF